MRCEDDDRLLQQHQAAQARIAAVKAMRPLVDKFLCDYPELKKQENWGQITALGEAVINPINPNAATTEERVKIYLALTHTYFYLGQYDTALRTISKANELYKEDPDLCAEHFYLTSAVYRAKGDKGNARRWIDKALELSNVSNAVQGTVYFNSGCLAHDLENDREAALEYYSKAKDQFVKNGDDYIRTELRIIRCNLENKQKLIAEVKAKAMQSQIIPDSKTAVHYWQLRGKISSACARETEAYGYFKKAFDLANTKGMTKDALRIEEFMREIEVDKDAFATSVTAGIVARNSKNAGLSWVIE